MSDAGIIAFLKTNGMYDAIAAQVAKSQPDAGDVHRAGAGKKKPGAVIEEESDPEDTADVTKARDFETTVDVVKIDDERMQIFGWASVSSINGEDVIDKQGDIIPIAEIEKAAYDYVLYSREQGDMHEKRNVGRLIESFVFTPEKASAGFVAKNENGEPVMGWAVGFQVTDAAVWKEIRSGSRPELSIGGRATPHEQQ